MCTSSGAPMQKNNAVFIADPDFDKELEKFLKEHRIMRNKEPSTKQQEYTDIVSASLKAQPSIVS